jgi:drug/metabolite transporter (DMT)-like permease
MRKTRVYIALFFSLAVWASSFPGIKASLDGYSPFELAAFRFLVASLVFAAVAPWVKVRLPRKRDIPLIVALAFGSACYHVALNYGEIRATAGAAAFIVNSAPVLTCVFAWLFLGEVMTWRAWAGTGVSLCGVWLIACAQGGMFAIGSGALILVVAAMCWSVFTILQKHLLTHYTPLEVCCYAVWIGTLFLSFLLPQTSTAIRAARWPATLAAIYLGVFPTTIAFLLWSYVLAHWPASRTSVYTYLIPLFSTMIAFVWVKEVPGLLFLTGGATILLGVMLATLPGPPNPIRKPV